MSTEAPAKVSKATWVDWVRDGAPEPDDDDLLTRDELIDRLHQSGDPVTTRELRYWEAEGALPQPVKRWHAGATRALYPSWMLDLVPRVRTLRQHGVPLPTIGRHLRKQLAGGEREQDANLELLLWFASTLTIHPSAYGLDFTDPEVLAAWPSTQEAIQVALGFKDRELDEILDQRAHKLFRATGRRVVSIDIVFRDEGRRALATMTRYPTSSDPPSRPVDRPVDNG